MPGWCEGYCEKKSVLPISKQNVHSRGSKQDCMICSPDPGCLKATVDGAPGPGCLKATVDGAPGPGCSKGG